MRASFATLAGLLLLAPILASGHLFNLGTRHEDCAIYNDPHEDSIDDGHAHFHHTAAAETAHNHGTTLYPVGHTHTMVKHDPCSQVGLLRTNFPDAAALVEITRSEATIGTGNAAAVVGDEAFQLDVATLQEVDNLVIRGDTALAALRLPGSGTPASPYILEGYLVRNVLEIKDTSLCLIVRDNVVDPLAVPGPIIDPKDLTDVSALVAAARRLVDERTAGLATAQVALDAADAAAAVAQARADAAGEALQQTIAAENTATATLAAAQAQAAQAQADAQQADTTSQLLGAAADALSADLAQAKDDLVAAEASKALADKASAQARSDLESARADLLAFADTYGDFIDGYSNAQAPQAPEASAPVSALTGFAASYADFVAESTPPSDADPTDRTRYEELVAQMAELQAVIDAFAAEVADAEGKAALAAAAEGAARQAVTDFTALAAANLQRQTEAQRDQEAKEAARQDAEALVAQLDARVAEAKAATAAAQGELETELQAVGRYLEEEGIASHEREEAVALLDQAQAQLDEAEALRRQGPIAYDGTGFASEQEVADHLIALVRETLDPSEAGRMVLDWNGPCVHAYNNVVKDLRVNRNNDRTGYATGGLLEENRFYTIGQIRHYDGEFRNNEVGRRIHGDAYAMETPPAPERAINWDGFNEANAHHNLIFGGVDLDYHGHHHSPGFFAPESHYHGSDLAAGYMKNPDGTFMRDANGKLMPHHDHTKRWTSVSFTDNTVIDPFGRGLRYEDEDHAGDDRKAASENMAELNKPHFHRTMLSIAQNTVLGQVRADILNAPGIDIWSDDLSAVKRQPITNAILDAVNHLGADVITTHPVRNDAWLDIVGNTIFLPDASMARSAIRLQQVKEAAISIDDNRAYVLPASPDKQQLPDDLVGYLQDDASRTPTDTANEVAGWGLYRTGIQQTAIEFVHALDSTVGVCGNEVRAFERGLRARDMIRTDVTFTVCAGNDWGTANPTVDIVLSAMAPDATLTTAVREVIDGSIIEPVADPVLDQADASTAPLQPTINRSPVGALEETSIPILPGVLPEAEHSAADALDTAAAVMDTTPAAPASAPIKQLAHKLH